MILKELAEIVDDWLDRASNTLLTYFDKDFWRYRNIAKEYARNFEFTKGELEFFEKYNLDYRTDVYYLKLASLGNYHYMKVSYYYFLDLQHFYEDVNEEISNYYRALAIS